MGDGTPSRRRGTLKYPKHVVSPQDFLTFVELDEFIDDWKKLGLDEEDDLWALMVAIMVDPEGPPVIEGRADYESCVLHRPSGASAKGKLLGFVTCTSKSTVWRCLSRLTTTRKRTIFQRKRSVESRRISHKRANGSLKEPAGSRRGLLAAAAFGFVWSYLESEVCYG